MIRYPVDGPASGAEAAGAAGSHLGHPFPLIVFAHGYDSHAGRLRRPAPRLGQRWVCGGGPVVSPGHGGRAPR